MFRNVRHHTEVRKISAFAFRRGPRAAQGCCRNQLLVKARDRRAALLSASAEKQTKAQRGRGHVAGAVRGQAVAQGPGLLLAARSARGSSGSRAHRLLSASRLQQPDRAAPRHRLSSTLGARPPSSAGCGRVAGEVKLEAKAWGKPAAWQLRTGQQQAESSSV